MTAPFHHAAHARILGAARKMTPGTFQGQSKVATPCGCRELLKPFGNPVPPLPLYSAFIFNDYFVRGWETTGNYPYDWTPTSPTATGTPVLFEDTYAGVTGCQLPDGRGFLMWTDGATEVDVRCAVQPGPGDWLTDDFVQAGDAGTIITTSTPVSAVPYVIDDELYATVSEALQTRIFKADNPADPVNGGWTLYSSLPFGTGVDEPFGTIPQVASVPVVAPDGTWAIVQGYTVQYYFGGPTGSQGNAWASFSSPDGVTWTRHLNTATSPWAEQFASRQFIVDSLGRINFAFKLAIASVDYHATPAIGGTLSTGSSGPSPPIIQAIIRNGADEIYAIDASGNFRLRVNAGLTYADWADTGVAWWPVPNFADDRYRLFVLTSASSPTT